MNLDSFKVQCLVMLVIFIALAIMIGLHLADVKHTYDIDAILDNDELAE